MTLVYLGAHGLMKADLSAPIDDVAYTLASAHRGKWGQLTPWKMDEKLKSENMQKRADFYVYFESNQGRQV